jgi:hypothetical protein
MNHTLTISRLAPGLLTLHITEHFDDGIVYNAQLTIPAHMATQLAHALDAARDHQTTTLSLANTKLTIYNASSIGPTDAIHIEHTSPSGLLDAISLTPATASALATTLRTT